MSMDFFERQEIADRRATRLFWIYLPVVCFFLVLGAASVAFLFTLACWSVYAQSIDAGEGIDWRYAWSIAVVTGAATLGFLLFEISAKWRSLARGVESVAMRLGGSELSRTSRDPARRRLLNIVDEMAIASGVPSPSVYVLEEEPGINAFVIGFSINNAVLGVTRGCVDLLTRDELQAVIAHEFSHVLNGDMQFNSRLIAMLHGVIRIKLWGEECYAEDEDGLVGGVAGGLLVTVGSLGVFFSRLLKSSICRQREFVADAAAVQFTRNPAALVGALKKIGGLPDGSRMRSPRVEEASHLFFGAGLRKTTKKLLATHPPLEDRIRCFEPQFDGQYPEITGAHPTPWEQVTRRNPQIATLEQKLRAGRREHGDVVAAVALVPAVVSQHIGHLSPEYLDLAAAMLAALPQTLRDASGECVGAEAIVLGLLLVEGGGDRETQVRLIEKAAGEPVAKQTRLLVEELASLQIELRLPLVETAIPALRHLTSAAFHDFKKAMKSLIEADRKVTLFELVLQRLVVHQLERQFGAERRNHADYFSIGPLQKQVATLLSLVAHSGNREADAALAAFERGASLLKSPRVVLQFTPRKECSLKDVELALTKLATATLPVKKQVVMACSACVIADGKVTVREAELFRLISESLDCPVPPVLL